MSEKTIVITGANGGLGTAVTNAILQSGARVFGVSLKISDADFPNPRFSAISAALSSFADAKKLIDGVVAQAGRIDALVHLVGGFAGGARVEETEEALFDRMLDMNLRSAFHLLRAALPHMRGQASGRIVAIGSKSAVEPAPLAGAYAASKAALVSLIRAVASENAGHGITANIVLPATMDTPANRAAMPSADPSQWIQPSQVASLIVHLLSEHASQINGAVIPVYGNES